MKLLLFDIDGTIVDMRYTIFYILKFFDWERKTNIFRNLRIGEIDVHENQVK